MRLLVLAWTLVCRAPGQELEEAARLDSAHRCEEAERLYRKAMAAGPPSPALLNNLGNHHVACGQPGKARAAFERLLNVNPAHENANLQLARLAIDRKDDASALRYLSKLDSRDPGVLFTLGLTCARLRLYERAETAFSSVLEQNPDDFEVLYNLGLAAARAGRHDRARQAFEGALKARPDDVDSLYELGRVETSRQNYARAVYLLAHARKQAPRRADVLLALARAAQMAAFYGDCLVAYDEYLKLRPGDDMVRRDRALVYGYTRAGQREGLTELRNYVEKHPGDAVGFYDLAQLTDQIDRDQALAHVSTAVRLAPGLEPARYYRAWLLQRMGRNEESIAELQAAIRLKPDDARALDLLGLNYLNLEQPARAEKPLRRALALLPDDPEVLFHLSRALIELGRSAEAQPLLRRFEAMREAPARVAREEAGIIEAATLTPAERSKRIVEQLRQAASRNPNDPALKLSLGTVLLSEGRVEEAAAAFRELLALNPGAAISRQAAGTLQRFAQYALAREFVERAAN